MGDNERLYGTLFMVEKISPPVELKLWTARPVGQHLTHCATRPRGYKTFFMLNSTEHENFPAHIC